MPSTPAPPVEALILAGRRGGERDPLAGIDNAPHKALLKVGGKALVAQVADALASSGRIGSIRIAADDDVRAPIKSALAGQTGWTFVDAAGSPAATILAALDHAPIAGGMLVTTCDHALLSPEMIRHFLDEARDAEAAAACVERSAYEARFPGSRRTFINLSDFSFSGANLFWFSSQQARDLAAFWRRLEQKRKKPLSMAREIGVFTAATYFFGIMSKRRLEHTLERKTGVRAKLIALPMAEAAIDVDKPEDLLLVRKILGEVG